MTLDAHKNFAYSTVATAPSPATSGTSLVVASGEGASFPAVPFNAVVCPVGTQPTAANAEIIRCTARSGDTLSTIVRTQEGTSARTIVAGDQIFVAVTAKTLTDVEAVIASTTLSVDTATIDFSSIPQTYRNLRLVVSGRLADAAVAVAIAAIRFNADGGGNYNYENTYGSAASTASIGQVTNDTSGRIGVLPAATTAAARIGMSEVLIGRYTNTSFHKPWASTICDGVQRSGVIAGYWASTAAINQITIMNQTSGAFFVAGTEAVLYGEN